MKKQWHALRRPSRACGDAGLIPNGMVNVAVIAKKNTGPGPGVSLQWQPVCDAGN